MTGFLRPYLLALAASLVAAPAFAQPPAAPSQSLPALVTESQKLLRDGHLDDAMASAKKAVATLPDSAPAHLQLGIVLDITGHYAEAREHLTMARDKSAAPQDATRASRAIAVSYAFESNCAGAMSVESPLVDHAVSAGDFTDAGEIANELARICLESGDVNAAETWYRKGHESAMKAPDLKDDGRDLWTFRWEHAQARLAARRGDAAAAAAHVAAAKATLDKGGIPTQAPFFPYLTGYVAFYGGNYATAIADLAGANQTDPFILCLTAQAYEKSGDAVHAQEYYRKVLASSAHNPANAYARPLAAKKVAP